MHQRHLNTTDQLAQKFEDIRASVLNLLQQPLVLPKETEEAVSSLLEEANVSLEELRVSEEELAKQNEELQESRFIIETERQHYLDLFEVAPLGYIVTNLDGLIREANRAAAELFNLSVNHLIGKPLSVFIPANLQPDFRQRLLGLASPHPMVKTWESRLRPRGAVEDRELIFAVTHIDYSDKTKENVRLHWLLHDITERKQSEEAKAEHRFRETFERAAVGIAHIDGEGYWIRVNPKLCEMLGYSRDELLELRSQDVTHPDDVSLTDSVHQKLVNSDVTSISIEKRYLHKNGQIVWTNFAISSVRDMSDTYAYGIAVINDITLTKQALIAEREQRLLADAFRETAMTLTSSLDLEEVLDNILAVISRIVPQEAASIFLIEKDDFHIVRGWGYEHEHGPELERVLKNLRLPHSERSIFDLINETKQALIFSGGFYKSDEWETITDIRKIHSLICIPIISHENVIGYLELHSSSPNFFTSRQVDQLQAFAAQAAIALDNARSHSQAKQLAAHEERQRLARDLHDSVTQTLFTSSLIAETLVRRAKKGANDFLPSLEKLHALNRGAIAEMRNLLMELRPDYLLRIHLPTQIHQILEGLRVKKDIETTVEITGDYTLPSDVQITLYRIAQEAINNVAKHSQASNLEVRLDIQPENTVLSISDNGCGFDLKNNAAGMGLNNMRERAESINALFEISSAVGEGTQVTVKWVQKQRG